MLLTSITSWDSFSEAFLHMDIGIGQWEEGGVSGGI